MEWKPQTKRDALISTKNKNVTVEKRLCCHTRNRQDRCRNQTRQMLEMISDTIKCCEELWTDRSEAECGSDASLNTAEVLVSSLSNKGERIKVLDNPEVNKAISK